MTSRLASKNESSTPLESTQAGGWSAGRAKVVWIISMVMQLLVYAIIVLALVFSQLHETTEPVPDVAFSVGDSGLLLLGILLNVGVAVAVFAVLKNREWNARAKLFRVAGTFALGGVIYLLFACLMFYIALMGIHAGQD